MENAGYRYKLLFEADIAHTWYSSGYCDQLLLYPAFGTVEIMNGLALILKPTARGFMILYDENRIDALLNYVGIHRSWSRLSFIMTATTQLFDNLTDLPTDMLSTTLYLSNEFAHPCPPPFRDRYYLHDGYHETGTTTVRVTRAEVKVTLPDMVGTYAILVNDVSGKTVIEKAPEFSKGQAWVYISLAGLPEGKYTILVKPWLSDIEVQKETLMYILSTLPTLAFLDMFFEAPRGQKPVYFPVAYDLVSTKQYLVAFEKRETIWRYYIILPGRRDIKKLFIQSVGNPYSFSGPEEVDIGDGIMAWRFESQMPIPLQQQPTLVFRLMEDKNGLPPEEIVRRLPAAGAAQVLPENKLLYSSIYLNI